MADLACSALLFIIVLLIFGERQARAGSCKNSSIDDAQLFILYEREELPPKVNILMTLDVHHAFIDERSSSVHLMADLHMSWKDNRLMWDEADYNNCATFFVDAERLWLPDVTFLNGGAINKAVGDPQRAKITSDGTVLWANRLDVVIPCTLQLTHWPTDTQKCNIKFGSRRHTIDEIDITIVESKYTTTWEAGAWMLLNLPGNVSKLNRAGEDYYIAEWTVSLLRRSSAHSLTTSAMFTAVVIELIAAGLLSPSARVPYCACVALSITLWLIAVLVRLPGAASAPVTIPLMSTLLLLSCIAALISALVQRVARLRSPPSIGLRRLLTKMASVFCLTYLESPETGEAACVWVAASNLLDRVGLIANAVALLIIMAIYLFV